MVVNLINDAGVMRKTPIGFSWTMLFFGPFVPLFRGDLKWMILHLLTLPLSQLFSIPFIPLFRGDPMSTLLLMPLFFFICWIVLPFIYNKRYIINLLERGYKPADEESRVALVNKGIIADMSLRE